MKLKYRSQHSVSGQKVLNLSEGEKLAKVVLYYGLLESIFSSTSKIVCPFHEDYNPSLLLNFEDGSWICFGCNKSGNALSFVKKYERKYNGLNDLEACNVFVHILMSNDKKIHKYRIVNNSSEVRRRSRRLYDEAYDYYHGLRQDDWLRPYDMTSGDVLSYMKDRGFSEQTLNKEGMKYTFNENYGIIFPMVDNGKFKGWVCRTTNKDIEKRRKYLYNKGFSRATTLVGKYGSKDYVFVVEGFMDRLKMIQNGEENVVAILGWKMSNEQIKKLKEKEITKVISALDNDECGRKGTKYLSKFFEVTRFCYMKGIKDPGDMDKTKFDKMYKKTMKMFHQNAKEAK